MLKGSAVRLVGFLLVLLSLSPGWQPAPTCLSSRADRPGTAQPGEETLRLVFVSEEGHDLRGWVETIDRSPLPERVFVRLQSRRGEPFLVHRLADVDARGAFCVKRVPSGRYQLMAFSAKPRGWASDEMEVWLPGDQNIKVTIRDTRH